MQSVLEPHLLSATMCCPIGGKGDSLAANPNILAHAEIAIARMLGFSIPALRNSNQSLQQEMNLHYRLKRDRDVKESELIPAIALLHKIWH